MIEIPGYKIHREIDRSDYCQSYSAIQLSSGKTMLVSIFSHSANQYESFKSIFNDIEQKIANKSFGVISPVKEFIKTQNHTYIISDLLSNSCSQVYKDRSVNLQILIEKIYKIAVSLDLYHQVGFYHGGITLDNIYHDTEENLTLGLAAFNHNYNNNLNDYSFDLNHESYKAPEKEVSHSLSRDFYALGVVLYELIFKTKPFISDNKEQLDTLKQAAVITIPDKQYDNLKPLFSALLSPNSELRVSNSEQFRELCSKIDLPISSISYQIVQLENVITSAEIQDINKSNNKKIPSYTYYLAALAISSVIIFSVLKSPSEDTERVIEAPAESLIESISDDEVVAAKSSPEFIQFLSTATNDLNNGQITSSLLSVNQALKIEPNNTQALDLKQTVENELKINSLLKQAEQLVRNGKIITPASNNALNTYKKIQAMLPNGDTRAIDGLRNISKTYFSLATKQYNLKNIALAKSIINEGLTAIPSDVALKNLKATIQKDENIAKELAEKELKAKETRLAQQRNKEQKNENEKLALIERQKQREIEIAKEQQALKNFQIQREKQRQQQINALIEEAELALNDTQLTLTSINKAKDNLQSLEFLSISSEKSNQLRNKITNAYISLTRYQLSVNQFSTAINTAEQGLLNTPENPELLSLKNQITNTLAQREEEKKQAELEAKAKEETSLPIFGTF